MAGTAHGTEQGAGPCSGDSVGAPGGHSPERISSGHHRPCRESQTCETQNKLECQASPTCERLHEVLGALPGLGEPRCSQQELECSPWLWRVCCSPCRAGTGTGAAQGMGSSPGSPWDRPWLVLLLLRLCLALVQAFSLKSCVSKDAVSGWCHKPLHEAGSSFGKQDTGEVGASLMSPSWLFHVFDENSPQKLWLQHKRCCKVGSSHCWRCNCDGV